MQELISELKRVEDYPMMPFVIRMATELIEKEKEQIIDAYMLGFNDSYKYQIQKSNKVTPRNGEEYYNQTYNQKQHIIDIMKADEDDGLYDLNK
jgi:hypothetical protein